MRPQTVADRERPEAQTPGAPARQGLIRAVGLGLITGAADDDPSAIGTYASAGESFGPSFLWRAPVTFPMMFAVVYLSAKLGQVAGEGLFAVLRKHYARWLLYPTLAAVNLLIPIPVGIIVVMMTAAILALQIWGSYVLMRNIFRILALALLAYVPAAILPKPDLWPVIRGR